MQLNLFFPSNTNEAIFIDEAGLDKYVWWTEHDQVHIEIDGASELEIAALIAVAEGLGATIKRI